MTNQAIKLLAKDSGVWNAEWMRANATLAAQAYNLDSFIAFARLMMYDPHKGEMLAPAKHHLNWIKDCFDHNRVVILAPPESAKTTIISVLLTAFTIGHKPKEQNIVVSVSDDQAEDIVTTIASYIEAHPAWKLCFPEIVPDKKRGWGVNRGFFVKRTGNYGQWLQERGAMKDPTMIGVGYSNRAILGKRATGVFIVDDMMDETNTRSEAELDAAKNIFVKVISSRPTEEGKLILVGTPWREDDVYASAVSTGLYKNHITPAITYFENVNGEKVAQSYWPEHWALERLERKRIEFGERDFNLMYMMDLEAAKGLYLKEDWIHPFFPHYEINSKWPVYWGVDFAVTSSDLGLRGRTSSQRSYFALAKIRAAPFGLVVQGGYRKRLSLGEAIELIKSEAALERPRKVNIEAWGSGDIFIQQLIRETALPIKSYRDNKDKATRFMTMARHFESNRVKISSEESDFLRVFKDEWISFPSSQKTYDTLDAVAAGLDAAGYNVYAQTTNVEQTTNQEAEEYLQEGWLSMPSSQFAPKARRRRSEHIPLGPGR